jgi:hypothetical protein
MPNPKEKLVYEGSADCTAIRIIHSNPLQENATYRADRRAPDSGKPIRITVEKQGHTVLPGDPITIKWRRSNHQRVVVEQDNPDSNYLGKFGQAYLVSDAEADYNSEESFPYCNWPVEVEFAIDIGKALQYREQSAEYKPGLTDDEIKETPRFKTEYESWVRERDYNWRRDLGFPPGWENIHAPLEAYEIQNEQNRIISDLRLLYNTQWKPWLELAAAYLQEASGSYWTGGRDGAGQPVYEDYYLSWTVDIELVGLFGSDGEEISYEGLSPHVLMAYEFVDEGGDFDDFDDWDSILRVNFMGTPEPLTVECDEDHCPGHCLEVRRETDSAWLCICSSDDLLPPPLSPTPKKLQKPPKGPAKRPTMGQRKAKAHNKLTQTKSDHQKNKEAYKAHGDEAERLNNLALTKRDQAKDPSKTQQQQADINAEADRLDEDRNSEIAAANAAQREAEDLEADIDDLEGFLDEEEAQTERDSGVSVGGTKPQASGWRPPLVQGGSGWNNTPTTTIDTPGSAVRRGWNPPQTGGYSGWNNTPTEIIDTPGSKPPNSSGVVPPSGWQNPQVSGGEGVADSGVKPNQVNGGNGWNNTPTEIIDRGPVSALNPSSLEAVPTSPDSVDSIIKEQD